ncbi:Fc.00g077710.m01.CDS01 [Cosmosporella sp. VM-42]
MSSSGPFSVTAHPYNSPTRHSCAYEIGPRSARNAIVFIGGLGDGPHTVPYVRHLTKHLEDNPKLSYSLFEIRMTSSFIGFGTSSLAKDVADITALVKYLRGLGKEKIVLFGHSTGCQDCLEYTDYSKHSNEPVDGFIMQGPISDRDALDLLMDDPQSSLKLAENWIADGRENDVLPMDKVPALLNAPISAYRFQSLAMKGGDDDYFSSDLDDETVSKFWTRFTKPVLVLHSGNDEFAPPRVDQAALSKKYKDANPLVSQLSGLIPGAGHTVDEPEAQEWLAETVIQFLVSLDK